MEIGECYLILGLDEDASHEQVKYAYRKLAMQYHPDKTKGDEFLTSMFKRIDTAYKILSKGSGNAESFSSKSSAPVYNEPPMLRQWIADYQRAQQYISEEQYNLKRIQSTQNIRYLSFQNLLKVIGGLVLISMFFYPERLRSNRKQSLQANQNRWVLKNEAILYKKPDMKGSVLRSLKSGDKLDSLGETKYYYKVRLDSGTKISGYILKNKIAINHE